MKNIKKDFPIFKNNKDLIYLDSAATTQKPQVVIGVMMDYFENYNANIHRGLYTISEKASERVSVTRQKVSKFINASAPEEIIFTRSATEAINLVMFSFGRDFIEKGDTVAVTVMDHHSNFVPWQHVAKEKKADFKVVDITKDGELDMKDLINKTKNANIFVLPLVSNMLGTINDVKKIIKIIKKNNPKIATLVDAAQAAAHMKIDVLNLDCDFLAISGHKMLASTGVGVLYGKKILLENMHPFMFGGDMIREVSIEKTSFATLPNKFEAGTLPIAEIISLGAAIDYLENIGMEKVHNHEQNLVSYSVNSLLQIDGVEIYGPKKRSGLVSFNVKNIHAHDIAQILADDNICVRSGHHCTMPLHERLGIPASVRASFYMYNDEKDIDILVNSIKKAVKIFK